MKQSKDIITPALTEMFNIFIQFNIFPDDLKLARVSPIFKDGDAEELGNYRPISIISAIARIFEKLIYNQLIEFLQRNEVLGNHQWGFRSLHSTALALIDCSNNWLINIDKKGTNFSVFLDIKKAFDTIDHSILLQKLEYYGIREEELKFFSSYLHNRRQCCIVNGHQSSFQTVRCGVPQGSILGPLLFIIYMNDLPKSIENGYVTMYADDTESSTVVNTCNDIIEKVIPDLMKICDWLKANRLSLNAVKTEFMLIGTYYNTIRFGNLLAIRIDDHLIKRVHKTKYLGIIVDDSLTWNEQIGFISTKIKRNVGMMKRVRDSIPKDSLITLYKSLVEPYFRYCNTVWGRCGKSYIDKLQTLQNRAARIVARVSYEDADHAILLRELEWLSISQMIEYDSLSLIYKIKNGHAPGHTRQMFEGCEAIHDHNTKSVSSGNFYIKKMNTAKGQTRFAYSGAMAWNNLPESLKSSVSLDAFQRNLKKHILEISG